jgi:oligopeptide transport system substrate-binding protein
VAPARRLVFLLLLVATTSTGYLGASPVADAPAPTSANRHFATWQTLAGDTTRAGESSSPPPPQVGSGPQVLTLIGTALGPVTLDPALIRDAEGSFLARQVFRGLVSLTPEMDVAPEIAERIDISPDRMRYTFTLRENAVFHDGTAIDAESVIRSIERATDPALADGNGQALPAAMYLVDILGVAERLSGSVEDIEGLRAVGARTLEVTLREPTVTFLFKLAGTPALIVDAASIEGDQWWTEPNGSGPFVLEELTSDRILLSRFDGFYGGAPHLEEVRVLQGSAVSQPLNLYEAGRIDVVETPLYALDRILSPLDPLHGDLRIVPQLSTSFILLSPNHAPFNDRNVRLAIAHAIDRQKIVDVSLESNVRLAEGIVPPGILGTSWNSLNPAYDIDAARGFLDAAGDLELPPTIFGGLATTAKLAIERDLGLSVDVITAEWPLFTARLADRSLPAFALTWIADYPDPSNFIDSMFHSLSPDNYIGYRNPEVDALLDAAAVEADEGRRMSMYLEAQQRVIDDAVLIPLFHSVSHTLVKPHVLGLRITPVGILDLEEVWIER